MTARPHFKRFPPYGKQLYEQRLVGHVPNGIYIVFNWKLAAAFPRIVIPDELPVADIELRFLAGLDVSIAYRTKDADRVPELAQAILQMNPRILNAFNADIPQNFIFKNSHGEVFA